MASRQDRVSLMPSILDRLLGQEVPSQEQLHRNRMAFIRQLKVSLQRDLENLLNTRCRCGGYPAEFSELEVSLVNYGIPDFTGANVGSQVSRDEFLSTIQEAIQRFEPRLKNVAVRTLDDNDKKEPLDRVLRFRVEAVLVTEYEAEPVAFVSTMEPTSGKFRVDPT
jgi:type VI secretion system protein ImpF